MEGDNSAMAHFCGAVSQLQRCADGTFRIEHHIPGEVRDLSRAKTCLHGKQDDDTVAKWVAVRFGEKEQIVDMIGC